MPETTSPFRMPPDLRPIVRGLWDCGAIRVNEADGSGPPLVIDLHSRLVGADLAGRIAQAIVSEMEGSDAKPVAVIGHNRYAELVGKLRRLPHYDLVSHGDDERLLELWKQGQQQAREEDEAMQVAIVAGFSVGDNAVRLAAEIVRAAGNARPRIFVFSDDSLDNNVETASAFGYRRRACSLRDLMNMLFRMGLVSKSVYAAHLDYQRQLLADRF